MTVDDTNTVTESKEVDGRDSLKIGTIGGESTPEGATVVTGPVEEGLDTAVDLASPLAIATSTVEGSTSRQQHYQFYCQVKLHKCT